MKLKKVLASVLATAMLLSLANIAVFADAEHIAYTEEDGKITQIAIYDKDGLHTFRHEMNDGQMHEGTPIADDVYVTLENDITFDRDNLERWVYIKTFKGTFDGKGHTIKNLFMASLKGYDWDYWDLKESGGPFIPGIDNEQYSLEDANQYNSFGYNAFIKELDGGTIKNVNFDRAFLIGGYGDSSLGGYSDYMGEKAVVAGYSKGESLFQNITITNSYAHTYNNSLAMCVSEVEGDVTFDNVIIDATNTLESLWGSYDTSIGGLTALVANDCNVKIKDCYIACVIDMFNDVCANYQWYQYRRSGMLLGGIKDANDLTMMTFENTHVWFDDWNQYRYCEWERNGHPSYSGADEYKYSRINTPNGTRAESFNDESVCAEGTDTTWNSSYGAPETHIHTAAEDNHNVLIPYEDIFGFYNTSDYTNVRENIYPKKGVKDLTKVDDNGWYYDDTSYDGITVHWKGDSSTGISESVSGVGIAVEDDTPSIAFDESINQEAVSAIDTAVVSVNGIADALKDDKKIEIVNNAKANAETTGDVITDVDVEVKANVKITSIDTTENSESMTFSVTPVATVTVKNNGIVVDGLTLENVPITNEDLKADQNITVVLPATFEPGIINHYSDNGDFIEAIDHFVYDAEANTVTLTITHFSILELIANTDTEYSIGFEETLNSDVYDIVLYNDSHADINRFNTADLTFTNSNANIGYEILEKDGSHIDVLNEGEDRYLFKADKDYNADTAPKLIIGQVQFIGYGNVSFTVADAATNLIATTTLSDNIVVYHNGTGIINGEDCGTLLFDDDATGIADTNELGVITATFRPATCDLTINIAYNNAINNNAKAYQDMKVVVSGGDLASNIEVDLGSDNDDVTFANDKYTVVIEDTLTENVGYTVTVSGAGYRTARYTVAMTGDKELNFWNNVKDIANAMAIETGKTTMTKNFLAGDIVKDNNINIYDLSAVVSYFGTENLVSAHPEYAKYDLNRDGVIDSKDVAYVLVSWGN